MVFVKLISLLEGVLVGGYEWQWVGIEYLAMGLYFFLVDRKRSV
jgi:hypothetical protein